MESALLKKYRFPLHHLLSIFFVCFLLLLPQHLANVYIIHILSLIFVYIILALGLQLVIGVTGLLDLGFIAFWGIGCYASALLSIRGVPFFPNLILSMLIAAVFRVAISIPSLRLRGDYYAIVTLGFGEITRLVLNNWDALTNGPKGLPRVGEVIMPPSFFGFKMTGPHFELYHYYLNLSFCLIFLALSVYLIRSPLGRKFFAVREDELAAAHLGIPLFKSKLLASVISAFYAGAAGALYVHWNKFISPESFMFLESVFLVCMVVLGGMGSIPGVIFATALLVGVPEALRITGSLDVDLTTYRYLFFGLALVLMTIFRPNGIFPERRPLLKELS